MTLGLILKRIRREWRLLAILLFAVALITGFFALGPLYIRTVTEVDLRHALASANPDSLKVMVVSNTPLTQNSQDILQDRLGELITGVERYKRASYSAPQISDNQNVAGISGTAICGSNFVLGTNPFLGVGSTGHCYQAFAFENLGEKVRVIKGRLPERGPTPDMVRSTGIDAEDQARQIGLYSRGEVEAIVTTIVAERDSLEIGSRFFIGYTNFQGGGALARVKIVGIVEPINPQDTYWQANTMFLTGADVEIDNFGRTRYDYGLAFHPAAFDEWVIPVLPNNVSVNYIWRLGVDSSVIDTTNAQDYAQALLSVPAALSDGQNQVSATSQLSAILSGYQSRVGNAEGPIILLSGAILILMLYHLVTTVNLVLQQQSKEWSTITSRGGSTFQLFKLQSVTIFILATLAFLLGPFISQAFMFLMKRFGPLATALDGVEVENISLPPISIWLSLGAALASIMVLSLPAIPASRQSLLLLKQAASRPPTRPAWARYFLDVIFVGIGLIFMLRLYRNVSDRDKSFSQLLTELFDKPAEVIKFVADRANQGGGLTDPFNLIAPALILTGFALFWLRLFPTIMRTFSRLASRSPKLTTPLAVWNVERDPAHYAQLVLLLIGTLALGTASLGLQATRDKGGWKVAREEIGGTASVYLNLNQGRYEDTDWDRLTGVTSSTPILYTGGLTNRDKSGYINVIGIDPADFAAAFPEFSSDLKALEAAPIERSGLPLSENAAELQVQLWSESIATAGTTEPNVRLYVYLQDAKGVPYRILLEQVARVGDTDSVTGQAQSNTTNNQPTPAGEWITFKGRMPISGTAPFNMWRVGIGSRLTDSEFFTHTIYLDYWQTIDQGGTATLVEGQEDSSLWTTDLLSTGPYPGVWQSPDTRLLEGINELQFLSGDAIPVFDGQSALRINYTMRRIVNSTIEPSVSINMAYLDRIPAIVSDNFANDFKQSVAASSNQRSAALAVGQDRDISITLQTGNIQFGLHVVNILETFPTLDEANNAKYFIILPIDTLRLLANQPLLNQGTAGAHNDVNQVWLELDERKPSPALKATLDQTPAVASSNFAWDRFGEILREPLPSAVAGMLFAGFWVSFILSLLDFAFYIAVTAKQRSFTFGVLRSLGWNSNNIWLMLLIEQVTLVTPALIVGSILGAGLAYLLLPFLSLVGGTTLRMPIFELLGLIAVLVLGFTLLLVFAALWLRRMSVNQVLRLGEE